MGFSPVTKRFWGRRKLFHTISVESAGNATSIRIIIAADILEKFPGARFAELELGDGNDHGFVRIIPCETDGENAYKLGRKGPHAHAHIAVGCNTLGVPKGNRPAHAFHPPFKIGDGFILVDLTALYRRRALKVAS